MSYFKAKMHQIRFLYHRPRWGSLRGPTSKGRKEGWERRAREGRGEGRVGEGKEDKGGIRGKGCVMAFGGWTPVCSALPTVTTMVHSFSH